MRKQAQKGQNTVWTACFCTESSLISREDSHPSSDPLSAFAKWHYLQLAVCNSGLKNNSTSGLEISNMLQVWLQWSTVSLPHNEEGFFSV